MSYFCEHFRWAQVRGQYPHEAVPASCACESQTKISHPSGHTAGNPSSSQAWSTGSIAVSACMFRDVRSINRLLRRTVQTSNQANGSRRRNLLAPPASIWGGIAFTVQLGFWIAHRPVHHLAMRLIRSVKNRLVGGARFSIFSAETDFLGSAQKGVRPMPQTIRGSSRAVREIHHAALPYW